MSAGLEGLADAAGAEIVRHEPVELDGVSVATTLAPPDAPALGRALSAIHRAGLAAVPLGAGRHLGLGNPPARADLFLSTAGLRGIEALEARDGVCRAGAGTPLGELRAATREAGWALPLEGPDEATLGGSIAAAAVGPRSHGFGPARDAVLGLDVVLASGERTRCGGRVVKNVTGYDLVKLYTGSLGCLGVIAAAWLRLHPLPEATRVLALHADGLDAACALARDASRRDSARACALHAAEDGLEVVVELAGDEASVAHDAAAIGGERADASRLSAVAARQWGEGGAPLRRYRIAVLATELPEVSRRLHGAGIETIAYPGPGLVYALFPPARDDAAPAAVEHAAAAASGPLRCEAAPPALKRRGDVFGASPQEALLFRALKQQFDPAGVLSPGRVVGAS